MQIKKITYTGNVKIYHSKELKELLYEGYVKEGIYHDEGKLYYDMAPYSLKYAGQFKTGKFNDEGEYFGIQGHTFTKENLKIIYTKVLAHYTPMTKTMTSCMKASLRRGNTLV